MQELVNISNISCDTEGLLGNDQEVLFAFLQKHSLDGVEAMLYGQWDEKMPPKSAIKGLHLRFWTDWLDFWQGNNNALLEKYGSEEIIAQVYGGIHREDWLQVWQENILQAREAEAEYVVFHISNACSREMYDRKFRYDDTEVIEAAIELLNIITKDLPQEYQLLLENLWWPGLTFKNRELCERLLSEVKFKNTGFMLDTGHLMNTNFAIEDAETGWQYVYDTVKALGDIKSHIRGIHLHQSLSGRFTRQWLQEKRPDKELTWQECFDYVSGVDQHQPVTSPLAREVVTMLKPQFLVHEFIQQDMADWQQKVSSQRRMLGF